MSFICSKFSINSLKIIFKWSLPLTSTKFFTSSSFFNVSDAVIFYSYLHLLLFLAPLWTDCFLGSTRVIPITSVILLLWVSSPHSIFSGPIAGKDIATSMSKSMYSSMLVLEERWWIVYSRNSASICINLVILFKTTKSHPKSTRIRLHTFKKHKSPNQKSQEEETAVKEINIAFVTPVPMLIETTFTTFKHSSFSRDTMSTKMCGFPLLVMTFNLWTRITLKMIRMPLQLYGMAIFQKRQSDIFR